MLITLFVRIVSPLLIVCLLLGCQNTIHLTQPRFEPLTPPNTRLLDTVLKIPPNASKEILLQNLGVIQTGIHQSRRKDLSSIEKSFRALHQQPHIVSALGQFYEELPKSHYADRLLSVKILGALKREDALETLVSIEEESTIQISKLNRSDIREKTLEMMICKRAVRGIAYLQTPNAEKITIQIITTHPLEEVRKEAIWAHLWNKGYSKQAVATLHEILPSTMLRWVSLPRFTRGMDPIAFDKQVQAWRREWILISDPDRPIRKDDIPRTRIGAPGIRVKPNANYSRTGGG